MTDPGPFTVLARAQPLGKEVTLLVHEAFALGVAMGRREGARAARTEVEAMLYELLQRLERDYETISPEQTRDFEMVFAPGEPNGYVAAYFGAAADALCLAVSRTQQLNRR